MTRLIVNPFFDHDFEVTPDPNVPNLYRHYPSEVRTHRPITPPHDKVTELLNALHTKRPDWVFLMSRAESKLVQVYTKDREHLGTAQYNVAYYGAERDYFQLINFRIAAETTKKTGGRCYSVAKAVPRILAKFRPMNLEELVTERREYAEQAANRISTVGRSNWMLGGYSKRTNQIRDFVLSNPEVFDRTPLAPLVEEMRPAWLAYMDTQAFGESTNFNIVTEVEEGGVKQLYNITGIPQAYWLDPDQHQALISSVSMLRMVDVGQVVPGIGFRSDERTFVVLNTD